MNIINAAKMEAIASYSDMVDWLRKSHLESVDAMDDLMLTQPASQAGDDTLLVRAAWQRGKTIGIKLITIFPGNTAAGDLPAIQAVYALFDGGDGRPLASLDGTELTYWKTAVDSALGTQLLAREDCESLLMVGAGAQAPYLIRAHCAVRPSIRRVSIWNRTTAKGAALADSRPVEGVDFESVTDLETAARAADLICCATAAEAPLVLGAWLRPGQHLDLVGGFKPAMRETDDEALGRSRVFVDARETTVAVCGDLCQPIAAGTFSPGDVEGDLFDLCRQGLARPRAAADITLFKNGGGGHLDLMTASYFVARAKSAGNG
ncbi:MAG: dehydrogenase [Lysobacterales bacterium]|nr:MAG: dehydrogenase [Xanthomonadales bacterium]